MAAIEQRPAEPAADVAEDPDFSWFSLRSPLEATFPLPNTGVVQRIAAGLLAKLQLGLLTRRDQHKARFVLDMISDWEDMDVELRTRVFQLLNVYAIVATHGWPTSIAATAASTNSLQCFLPPGIQLSCNKIANSLNANSREVDVGLTTARSSLRHQHHRPWPLAEVEEDTARGLFTF